LKFCLQQQWYVMNQAKAHTRKKMSASDFSSLVIQRKANKI